MNLAENRSERSHAHGRRQLTPGRRSQTGPGSERARRKYKSCQRFLPEAELLRHTWAEATSNCHRLKCSSVLWFMGIREPRIQRTEGISWSASAQNFLHFPGAHQAAPAYPSSSFPSPWSSLPPPSPGRYRSADRPSGGSFYRSALSRCSMGTADGCMAERSVGAARSFVDPPVSRTRAVQDLPKTRPSPWSPMTQER